MLSPESTATITWDIPEGTPAGAAPLHSFNIQQFVSLLKCTLLVQSGMHLVATAEKTIVLVLGCLHCN